MTVLLMFLIHLLLDECTLNLKLKNSQLQIYSYVLANSGGQFISDDAI